LAHAAVLCRQAQNGYLGIVVLHGLLHVILAVALPTGAYLVASRVVNWGRIAVGLIALSAYVRRLRASG
jgi:hypothetical protein